MTEQRTTEWHNKRKGRVTASVAGAILGVAPYMTRGDVLRMMVRDTMGAEREFTGNVATEWGTFNEDGVKAEFEMETRLKIEPCGFFEYEDWLGASPDGLIGVDGIFECKAPYGIRSSKEPEFKSIEDQPHYMAQIQIQMLCTGRTHCHFYQWTPHGTKHEVVYFSQKWIQQNLGDLTEFYNEYLVALESPEDHLSPRRVVVDTPQAHKMVMEYDEIKEQLELLEERKKDLLDAMIALGKGSNALIAGRKLTKVEKAGAVSYAKVVKEKLPELDLTPWTGKASSFWKLT